MHSHDHLLVWARELEAMRLPADGQWLDGGTLQLHRAAERAELLGVVGEGVAEEDKETPLPVAQPWRGSGVWECTPHARIEPVLHDVALLHHGARDRGDNPRGEQRSQLGDPLLTARVRLGGTVQYSGARIASGIGRREGEPEGVAPLRTHMTKPNCFPGRSSLTYASGERTTSPQRAPPCLSK